MNTTTNTTSTNNIKMMVVLVMLLLSSVGFAQNTIEVPAVVVATTTTVTESNTATLNMVSWFMGTKQNTNEATTKETSTKKQMMTSGIAPNRLLIKAFLKKASQFASNIA